MEREGECQCLFQPVTSPSPLSDLPVASLRPLRRLSQTSLGEVTERSERGLREVTACCLQMAVQLVATLFREEDLNKRSFKGDALPDLSLKRPYGLFKDRSGRACFLDCLCMV